MSFFQQPFTESSKENDISNNKLKEAKEKDDSNEKEKEYLKEHCNSNSVSEEKSKPPKQP